MSFAQILPGDAVNSSLPPVRIYLESQLHHFYDLASLKIELLKPITMETLEKNKIEKKNDSVASSGAGCCGGAPASNADACCKLDEDKKAEGQSGCGCNSGGNSSSCC